MNYHASLIESPGTTNMGYSRYTFLDGIRGMAAIFVLMRHTSNYWHISFYRSYLAVDLFFILSGFVIASAYDEKIRDGVITLPKFVLIRLIRLYPVFLLSLLLCLGLEIDYGIKYHVKFEILMEIVSVIAITALFLPSHLSGSSLLFPINSPYWSLFFELVSNVIYAAIRPFLNNFTLTVIVFTFGLIIAGVSYQHGNMDSGNVWGYESFIAGFSRSVFGIFFGLLLHRYHVFFERRLGKFISPWFVFVVIAIILSSPQTERYNWIIDVMSLAVVFPLCVLFASQRKSTRLESMLLMLGSASYPIYVLHIPVAVLLYRVQNDAVETFAPVSGIALVVILIALSVLVEKYYDIPIRRWISNSLFSGTQKR